MLDVHPAHHTATTWRDFFIHLATIILGLLIAIGLEQSVEALHHWDQGRRLEADLRQEALTNRSRIALNEDLLDRDMVWLLKLRRNLNALRSGGPKESFVYPAPPERTLTSTNRIGAFLPEMTIWSTAKESSAVQWLPRERARRYNMTNNQADIAQQEILAFRDQWLALDQFEFAFSDGVAPGQPDVKKMTRAELEEYARVVGNVFIGCRDLKRRMRVYSAWNEGVLGPEDEPIVSSDDYLRTHPDDPDAMAREIEAEDAKPHK
jgi:hypothetical protein